MICRQQKSERVCVLLHVSAHKTKVLIIICAAKLLYCNGFAKLGGVKNVKESDFLSFLSNKASFMPMCVRLRPHFFCPRIIFCPRITRIYTNFPVLFINGDLYGRTNHTNSMTELIELVKIRATEQVAIII